MPDPAAEDATLIGIDYGTRRIGLAVGGTRSGAASPLGSVANANGTPDWAALDARVEQWAPDAFVVGWPLGEDGGAAALLGHVRGFARRLRRRYGRPVHTVDERYSSVAAAERIAAARRDGRRARRATRADVDAVAAAVILERWREGRPDDAPPAGAAGPAP